MLKSGRLEEEVFFSWKAEIQEKGESPSMMGDEYFLVLLLSYTVVLIVFVVCSPNAGLSQVSWDGSPWYDLAKPPRSRGKNEWHGQTMCCSFLSPSAVLFLFSFVASFIFIVLEFSLNCFFTLIVFNKKGNAVPMKTRD